MNWRRELALRDAQEQAAVRDTSFWHQAVRELQFTPAEMQNITNVRMVAIRAQQIKESHEGR